MRVCAALEVPSRAFATSEHGSTYRPHVSAAIPLAQGARPILS
jgi:hypothetical protein